MSSSNGEEASAASKSDVKDQSEAENNTVQMDANEQEKAPRSTEEVANNEDGQAWNSIPWTHLDNPFNRNLLDKTEFSKLLEEADNSRSIQRIDRIIESIKKMLANKKTLSDKNTGSDSAKADNSDEMNGGANGVVGDGSLLQDHLQQAFSLKSKLFGTKASFWIEWISHEQSLQNYDGIEKIFEKCLRSTPCVSLYTEYIDYIQHVHSPQRASSEEEAQKARTTIIAAFEFVMNAVGSDIKSGDLWMRYLRFVKAGEAQSSYEEQQKMDLMRKIFHKAVHTPILNIEEIWKEYDAFENNLSKLTAKKFIADQAGGYMTARGAIKDLKSLVDPIDAASHIWIPQQVSWTSSQIQMLNYWKRYISWERSNPLAFEDATSLIKRVSYTYQSALLDLRYFPELWFDYAVFLMESASGVASAANAGSNTSAEQVYSDQAVSVLRQGIRDNPKSLLLVFTLAEYLETRKTKDFKEISDLFEDLLQGLEKKHSERNAYYDSAKTELQEYLAKNSIIPDIEGEDEGERRERERSSARDQIVEIYARVEKPRINELTELCRAYSLTWIVFMRLTRRSQSIRAARLLFSRARKSTLITSHVFIASALMEYYVNKDSVVAGKIFEVGLKTFPLGSASSHRGTITKEEEEIIAAAGLGKEDDGDGGVGYILTYIDFLICLNDDNNTRALFERALSSLPSSKSRPLWDKYIDYETQYGDLTNLHGLEKRYAALFPPRPVNSLESVEKIASKWAYFDIDYIASAELGISHLRRAGERKPEPAVASSAPIGQLAKLRASQSNQDSYHHSDKSKMMPMLSGINVDKYPKPDFSRWNPYKAEPGNAKVCEVVEKSVVTNGPKEDPVVGKMSSSESNVAAVGILKPDQAHGHLPGSTILVPEQIADFMARLPRKESYIGPTLNNNEILALIFAMPIPPLKTPKYVPAPAGYPETASGQSSKHGFKRSGRWEDDDFNRNKRHR